MKSNFYGSRKSLVAIVFSVAFLSGTPVIYAVNESLSIRSSQQVNGIKGTVKDANGEAIIGASVVVKGTANGTITDFDGMFTISGVSTNDILQVSFVGYKTLEVQVKDKKNFSLILTEDTEVLDEVVVVGYGTMKKTDVTGSMASVSSDKLTARGTVRVEDALQGSVPGVNITQSNSRANGKFDIQIRGQASINNTSGPLYVVDGMVVSSIDFLNPEDIERIDVLKDASSTAIYGSRASEGVIIISTKGAGAGQNKAQPVEISYDGYYGIRKVARMPEFMESTEWMDYRFARFTTGAPDETGHAVYKITDGDLQTAFQNGAEWKESPLYDCWRTNKTYDWADQVLRTASQQNHFLSASGATEKTSYRLGAGYQNEENVFKKNDYKRYNIKGSFDSKLSKVVEAGMSVNLVHGIQNDWITETSNSYSPYNNAFWFAPVVSPWDENGNLLAIPAKVGKLSLTSTASPLVDFDIDAYENETRKFHVFGNAYLRFNIMDNLKFTTTFSPNYYHGRQGIFMGTGVSEKYPLGTAYYQKQKYNKAEVVNTERLDWTWDNQVDFSKTWGEHRLNAMGMYSMYYTNKETYKQSVTDISDDKLSYNAMDKGSGTKTVESAYTESSLVSFAARLNYAYKERYMATVTVRTDGSSRFAKDNRWGWFPSAAFAWRASEEDFLRNVDWIDNLKLRLSYGVTGNNNVDDYVTSSSASGPSYAVLGGQEYQGYYANGLVDRNLIWEKIKELNFGIDLSVLKNRINVTADAYRRLSDGQIMKATVPLETGESSITTNIGSIQNTGIEIGLSLGILRNKNFTWDMNLSFARNWSKIKELPNGDDVTNNWFIGERLNVLRDYTSAGIITADGVTMHTVNGDRHYTLQEVYDTFGPKSANKLQWYEGQMAVNDWNDDGKINDDDKQIYGCTDPKWTGSLSSTITYKDFDFSFMLYTKQGQWSRSYFHEQYMDYNDRGRQKMSFDYYIPAGTPVLDKETGDITWLAEAHVGSAPYPNNSDKTGGGYFKSGSASVRYQKTSFVKVKNVTLGYTFPKEWMNKVFVKHLRLYINVLNPFCFTNYKGFDPEWASANLTNGGPASITYQIGANIKF
ncbi:SusC/RagA family TonB-linked outer membrane protein [Phocaeicola sartorii]|uniref:SusC/RagA family TonB-linked outer membrane protein n=1 Tax=Phocaeicola sartorii TaxID=671267 RepID=R9I4Z3_9BACT|nr:TonB-dependent receptor [Phocaeicola sartorii]EOS11312.1 SusC/RagA family TonB-linked outer membrane protein [Phocaeicola sartorii]MCR1843805.1 TonB-dependent receptor [Phocaeicola sartorii]NUK97947.1 TonB-dependent receptor [Phocaeicola sartorii]